MEDKKRYGRIQHAPYSLDLAPFDFAFSPTEIESTWTGVSDLNEVRTESDL